MRQWPDTAASLSTPARQVLYPTGAPSMTTTTTVDVNVTLQTPAAAMAPAWTGLVTAVRVAPGARIEQGTPILEIDGSPVRAAVTPQPFYRPLHIGDTGTDVVQLRALLRQVNQDVAPYGALDHPMAKAIATWLGLPLRSSAFDPADVVWVPQAGAVVHSIAAVPGAPAPAPGTAVLTFEPIAVRATAPASPPGAAAEVDVGGTQFVAHDGELALDSAAKASLGELAAAQAQPPTASAEGSTATADHATISGAVTLTWAEPVVSIPTTAIVVRNNGSLCVVVKRAGRDIATSVTVVASLTSLGESQAAGLPARAVVVVNPVDSGSAGRCQA